MAKRPQDDTQVSTPDAQIINNLANEKLGMANQQAAQEAQQQQDADETEALTYPLCSNKKNHTRHIL